MVARELLDLGEFQRPTRSARRRADRLCSRARRRRLPRRLDRAALPQRRAGGRARVSPRRARSPRRRWRIARAAYWQGRAAEAIGQGRRRAALLRARRRLPDRLLRPARRRATRPRRAIALRAPRRVASGEARDEATRDRRTLLRTPGSTISRLRSPMPRRATGRDEAQIAALAEVVARRGDATTNVTFGKIATERGFPIDEVGVSDLRRARLLAAAAFGRPRERLAVARQESEFSWRAASGAGAKGLMQILPATAQSTARRAGVAVRFRPPDRRSRLQPAARRGLSRPVDGRRGRFAGARARRLQRGRRPRRAMDSPPTAIRAAAKSIPSTGSSASRSTRRATTSSASARTSASIARGFAAAADAPPEKTLARD